MIEFSVVGQNMLGWIDRRCWQRTRRLDLPFGGITVIFVGDFLQLSPVMDKVLFCKNPNEENEAIRLFVFKLFDKVVNLTKDEGSKGQNDDQKRFSQLLFKL